MKLRNHLWIAIPLCGLIAMVWLMFGGSDGHLEQQRDRLRTMRTRRIREADSRQRGSRIRIETSGRMGVAVRSSEPKPEIEITDEEEAQLDVLQKKLLQDIQLALDSEDFNSLVAALDRLRMLGVNAAQKGGSSDWARFTPAALRRAVVSALGWFGGNAIPELTGFLADPDPDVLQSAIDQFELAMDEGTLGDREKAEIIKRVATIATDDDLLEWIFAEAVDARHSVGIDTLVYIAQNGTEPAQGKVKENLEFFTGDDTIHTIEDAQRWLAENPDGEEDDFFYGGSSEAE